MYNGLPQENNNVDLVPKPQGKEPAFGEFFKNK